MKVTAKSALSPKQGSLAAAKPDVCAPGPVHEILTRLEYLCTETGEPSKYEVPGDAAALKDLWPRTLALTCAQCGQIHRLPFREAYIKAIISDAAPVWLERL